jgi:hypothetical protein
MGGMRGVRVGGNLGRRKRGIVSNASCRRLRRGNGLL